MNLNSVLFVCLGNICRSPAAEAVFNHVLIMKNIQHQFKVDSAGTGGWHVGSLPDKRMRKTLEKRGISTASRARKFTPEDFDQFNYIIVMDSDNREAVFSLRESHLKNHDKIFKLRKFDLPEFSDLDVPDPWYGFDKDFEEVVDICERCVPQLLDYILSQDKQP